MLKYFKLVDGEQFHQYCWLRSKRVGLYFCRLDVTVYAECRLVGR